MAIRVGRRWRIGLFAGISALLVLAIVVVALDTAQRHLPEFYLRAAPDAAADLPALADLCTRQALALVSSSQRRGPWQASFTADQLNAWLAIELRRHFPAVLPDAYQEPRIAIEPHRARLGILCGDASPRIYSIEFDLFRAGESSLGLRIHRVRFGALPLPLGAVVQEISAAASRGDLPLQWKQQAGDPIAIIAIAPAESDYLVSLDTVELRDGSLYLSGQTKLAPAARRSTRAATRR